MKFQNEAISEQQRLEESRLLIDDLGLKAAEKGSLDRFDNEDHLKTQLSLCSWSTFELLLFQWGLFW